MGIVYIQEAADMNLDKRGHFEHKLDKRGTLCAFCVHFVCTFDKRGVTFFQKGIYISPVEMNKKKEGERERER
jgi:hypothetical protein